MNFHKNKFIFVIIIIVVALALFIGLVVFLGAKKVITPEKPILNENISTVMKIESPVFENNRKIPAKYTCDGANINPPFIISGTPENAKSLVLIVDDPDAPAGTWVHWTLWNLDPALKEIEEDSVPEGIEGVTSFGKPGYGGPCPPSGTHRYFFKLYALDTILSISEISDKKVLEEAMKEHILASTEIVGLYSRK